MSSLYLTLSSMRQLIPVAFQISSQVAPSLSAKWAQELFLRPRRLPYSQKEEDILKSAQTETLQSGRKAYFWNQNSGAPLVTLVHGWESRASAFYKWIPILVNSGFQVMGWDGPAHGYSPGIKTNAYEVSKALASDLQELNVTPFGVVGHSLGGVAIGLLHRHIALPKKMIIVSAPSNISGVFDRYLDTIKLGGRARSIFVRSFEKSAGITLQEGSLQSFDMSEKSHTLVIHDTEDREVPFEDFHDLKKSWPKAQFLATDGLGHRRILRDEAVGFEIAEFLKS